MMWLGKLSVRQGDTDEMEQQQDPGFSVHTPVMSAYISSTEIAYHQLGIVTHRSQLTTLLIKSEAEVFGHPGSFVSGSVNKCWLCQVSFTPAKLDNEQNEHQGTI